MLVRRANAEDASTLTALTQASGAYAGEYRALLDTLSITPQQVERELFFLVEDDHGGTVGYYSLIIDPPAAADHPPAWREAELDLLFVADHAQGGGLGALMFRHMTQQARGHGIARVRIVSHPPAEPFYLRMGCTRIGVEPPHGRVTWERPRLAFDL